MKKLSIALAVFNEEKNLYRCLDAIRDFGDELIIVDGGSADTTVAIAEKFGATVIKTDNPPIFHRNKQKALEACHGEWILQLDADEIVTPALRQEISNVIGDQTMNDQAFYIPRRNIFWGHPMRKTGVYPDYVIRLLKNGKGRFPSKSVHEQIAIDGSIGHLKQPLLHYSYSTMHDYWRKAGAYTSLTAQDLKQKKIPQSIGNFMRFFVVQPIKTFFTIFVRNQGFVDGIYGFLFALFSAWHHPIAYWKYLTG